MAILFADNFDRYNENMLDMRDVWRDIAQSQDTDLYWHVSTVRAATGTQSAGRGAQTEDASRDPRGDTGSPRRDRFGGHLSG